MRRGLPLLPTLVVVLLAAFLAGLGVWQLERREWKHALMAQLAAQPALPPVDAASAGAGGDLQFRRGWLECRPGRTRPYDLKGGSSRGGDGGFLVLVSCRAGDAAPAVVAVAGWTRDPRALEQSFMVDTRFEGLLIERPYGDAPGRPKLMLIANSAVPGLEASRLPTPEELPDNHLAYAGQWFGLSATLLVIYGLWLRRRARAVAAPAAAR